MSGSVISRYSNDVIEVRNVRGCIARAVLGDESWSVTNVDGTVVHWSEGQPFEDVAPPDPEECIDGTGAEAIDAILERIADQHEQVSSGQSPESNTSPRVNAAPPAKQQGIGGAIDASDSPNDGLWRLDPLVQGRVCSSGEGSSAMIAIHYYNGNRACYFGDGTAIFATAAQRGPSTDDIYSNVEVQCPELGTGVVALANGRARVLMVDGCIADADFSGRSAKWSFRRRDGIVVTLDSASGVAHVDGGCFSAPAGPIAANLERGELAFRQHNCALLSLFQVCSTALLC